MVCLRKFKIMYGVSTTRSLNELSATTSARSAQSDGQVVCNEQLKPEDTVPRLDKMFAEQSVNSTIQDKFDRKRAIRISKLGEERTIETSPATMTREPKEKQRTDSIERIAGCTIAGTSTI